MTRIIAHRGASGDAPENTLPAFELALTQQADGIELDVHLSKDGVPVVCHDYTVDRTTDGTGSILSMESSELITLDAGSWYNSLFKGTNIPLLSDVLKLVKERCDTNFLLNIELKSGSKLYPRIEQIVLDQIADYNLSEQVIISSFDHFALREIKNLNPQIKTGALYSAALIDPWEYRKVLAFDALHPAWHTLTPEIIRKSQALGIQINTYTVNDLNYAKQLLDLGVDGIITNFPGEIIKLRDN